MRQPDWLLSPESPLRRIAKNKVGSPFVPVRMLRWGTGVTRGPWYVSTRNVVGILSKSSSCTSGSSNVDVELVLILVEKYAS
jgi:hypothetical protein